MSVNDPADLVPCTFGEMVTLRAAVQSVEYVRQRYQMNVTRVLSAVDAWMDENAPSPRLKLDMKAFAEMVCRVALTHCMLFNNSTTRSSGGGGQGQEGEQVEDVESQQFRQGVYATVLRVWQRLGPCGVDEDSIGFVQDVMNACAHYDSALPAALVLRQAQPEAEEAQPPARALLLADEAYRREMALVFIGPDPRRWGAPQQDATAALASSTSPFVQPRFNRTVSTTKEGVESVHGDMVPVAISNAKQYPFALVDADEQRTTRSRQWQDDTPMTLRGRYGAAEQSADLELVSAVLGDVADVSDFVTCGHYRALVRLPLAAAPAGARDGAAAAAALLTAVCAPWYLVDSMLSSAVRLAPADAQKMIHNEAKLVLYRKRDDARDAARHALLLRHLLKVDMSDPSVMQYVSHRILS